MKKFLICLTALVLFGCTEKAQEERIERVRHEQKIQQERIEKCKPKTYYSAGNSIVVGLEIEGHQYLIYKSTAGYGYPGHMIHAEHCPCHGKNE